MSEKIESTNQLRPIYFQPRQIVFHAHGNLSSESEILDALEDWANGIAESKGISLSWPDGQYVVDFNPMQNPDIYFKKKGTNFPEIAAKKSVDDSQGKKTPVPSKKSYQSPPIRIPPAFSLAKIIAHKEGWPEPNTDSRYEEADKYAKMQVDASNELLDLIMELDRRRDNAPVKLEVVCPNWVMSGSSRPGGTGGPGGPPSTYAGPPNTTEYEFQIDTLPPRIYDLVKNGNKGAGVAVAILDTAYTKEQLEDFYQTMVVQKPTEAHPIIQSLLGKAPLPLGALRNPDGSLRVHTDPAIDNNLPGLKIDGHDYDMTDHCLSVAGIINLLASQAEIYQYQALNKYGLGDLFTIASTLQRVMLELQNKRFLVNLSLTINLPPEDGFLKPNDQFKVGEALLNHRPWWLARMVASLFNWIFGKPHLCACDTWFERQVISFEWISDLVYALNSRVIAAAGNESSGKSSRLPALYPAAFESVLGVGALARGTDTTPGLPATYSNLADTPVTNGISTLGGEEGEAQGILCVYMGEIPNGTQAEDKNGWAWWSGTSFATPIVTGITAAILSCLSPGSTAEDAIAELFTELEPSSNTNVNQPTNEDILFIKQG